MSTAGSAVWDDEVLRTMIFNWNSQLSLSNDITARRILARIEHAKAIREEQKRRQQVLIQRRHEMSLEDTRTIERKKKEQTKLKRVKAKLLKRL